MSSTATSKARRSSLITKRDSPPHHSPERLTTPIFPISPSSTSSNHNNNNNADLPPACAECRRVKRRCSRKWPCQSCVRRGCASICPDGTLTPGGGGNRYILHGSEVLHKRLREMSARIEQLEEALREEWREKRSGGGGGEGSGSGSGEGGNEHELLRKELLAIKIPPDTQNYEPPGMTSSTFGGSGGGGSKLFGGLGGGSGQSVKRENGMIGEDEIGEDVEDDLLGVVDRFGTLAIDAQLAARSLNGVRSERLGISTIEFILNSKGFKPLTQPGTTSGSITPAPPTGGSAPSEQQLADLLRHPPKYQQQREEIDGSRLPLLPAIFKLAASFPSVLPPDSSIDLSTLMLYLPSLPLAMRLVQSYFEGAGWTYTPITLELFLEDILPVYYPSLRPSSASSAPPTSSSSTSLQPPPQARHPHQPNPAELSMLYLVLCIGAQVDIHVNQPTVVDQSERYLTLAKASLCLKSPLTSGSVRTVEVLTFLLIYTFMWDQSEVNMELVAVIMALSAKWGLTMGLHRDGTRLRLPPPETERRRWVWWELFTTSLWQSLSSGRPSFLQVAHFDTKVPIDPHPEGKLDEKTGKKVYRHPHDYDKFRFARTCLWPIVDSNFNLTKPVTYAAVLALGRKVWQFEHKDASAALASVGSSGGGGGKETGGGGGGGKEEGRKLGMEMQTYASWHVKVHLLLHLHREFFAHALTHHPNSPLDSPYAASVLATFKCSIMLLERVSKLYDKLPEQVIAFGLNYTDVLSSAVAMGSIVSRGPRGSLAPVAYKHLKLATDLIEQRFADKPRAKPGLPIMYKLQHEANRAISAVGPGPGSELSFSNNRGRGRSGSRGGAEKVAASNKSNKEGNDSRHVQQQQQRDRQAQSQPGPSTAPTIPQLNVINLTHTQPPPVPDFNGNTDPSSNQQLEIDHSPPQLGPFQPLLASVSAASPATTASSENQPSPTSHANMIILDHLNFDTMFSTPHPPPHRQLPHPSSNGMFPQLQQEQQFREFFSFDHPPLQQPHPPPFGAFDYNDNSNLNAPVGIGMDLGGTGGRGTGGMMEDVEMGPAATFDWGLAARAFEHSAMEMEMDVGGGGGYGNNNSGGSSTASWMRWETSTSPERDGG